MPRTPAEITEAALGGIESGAGIVHNHNDEPMFTADGVHAVGPYLAAWRPVPERPGVIELSKFATVPNSTSFRSARGWLASARYTFGSALRPRAAQAAASASRASELVPTSPGSTSGRRLMGGSLSRRARAPHGLAPRATASATTTRGREQSRNRAPRLLSTATDWAG